MAAGVRPPVFVSGRIEAIQTATPDFDYSNDIHHLAWDGLPDAFNERLRQRIARTDPLIWQFEGRKVAEAPGWKNGECKPRDADEDKVDILRSANLRAIGVGTQYGDMVALVAEALRSGGGGPDHCQAAPPHHRATSDGLRRWSRHVPRQFRELVVQSDDARRQPHAAARHAQGRAKPFATGAAAICAPAQRHAAARADALSRYRHAPHLPGRRQREELHGRVLSVDAPSGRRRHRQDRIRQRLSRSRHQCPPDQRADAARRRSRA